MSFKTPGPVVSNYMYLSTREQSHKGSIEFLPPAECGYINAGLMVLTLFISLPD